MPPSAPCRTCNYDLSGQQSGWTQHCPLEGTCPECGRSFLWSDVFSPANRLRWAFDVPGTHGLSIRRWWATTALLLNPPRFWRRIANERLVPRRLVLWLALLFLQLHVITVTFTLIHRAFNVAFWSTPGDPFPFWQGISVTCEMLFMPYYDAGEVTAKKAVEPMFFLDRFRISLACGSLVAAAALLLISRTNKLEFHERAWRRVLAYGLMPVALMYAYWTFLTTASILLQNILHSAGPWWYGRFTNAGREVGVQTWITRGCNAACVAWLASWWWCATCAVFPTTGRWIRVVAVTLALATAAAVFVQYLSYWGRWVLI